MENPETAALSTEPAASARRPDASVAFRLARRKFVAGDRLDMQQLAAGLGVDRTTLFRWLGNRDQLTAEILISLTDPTIQDAIDRTSGSGGLRVARVARAYAETLIDTRFFRAFLQREPERALRLLTSKASPIQQYVVRWFERLLQEEGERGSFTHPMASGDLAYLIVRIMESFVYADMITGDEPDAAKVETAVAALLHADRP